MNGPPIVKVSRRESGRLWASGLLGDLLGLGVGCLEEEGDEVEGDGPDEDAGYEPAGAGG
jgi:hypothetical protein